MPADPATTDLDALRSALEAARDDLLASFYAKQEADRRYVEAFAAYERLADSLRRTSTVAAIRPREPGS